MASTFQVRCTAEQLAEWRRLAKAEGRSMNTWALWQMGLLGGTREPPGFVSRLGRGVPAEGELTVEPFDE